ncbi:hypothetical protein EDD86DRAFT_208796 [Gorgonomyces haynaldii]|nr:hypothetical protein EDD86DRAFT_208796 [Gorgonomyces haynaldii]
MQALEYTLVIALLFWKSTSELFVRIRMVIEGITSNCSKTRHQGKRRSLIIATSSDGVEHLKCSRMACSIY